MIIWTVVRHQRSLDPAIAHIVLLECCLHLASEYHLSALWMLALPAATVACCCQRMEVLNRFRMWR
ncbi:hypothetical protein DL93DRAFT_2087546 [Clavulina sp. PMI_390]|nr:hypothetical protein DL93DRAFT_2087546 [Clavulina sp. PMI_390]